jgi:hypothetical protein
MERKLLDQIQDDDAISVALRGGAGWIHGTVVWRRDDVMLLKVTEGSLPPQTPYALIFTSDVTAVAVPRAFEPPTPEPRKTGFSPVAGV